MPSNISKILIKADRACDYVPGLSAATNSVDLIIKAINILSNKDEKTESQYIEYLKNKSFFKCAIAAIPFARPIQAIAKAISTSTPEKILSGPIRPDINFSRNTYV